MIIPLLLLYFNAFPSPADFKIFALIPGGFLILIIINLAFIILWLIFSWKYLFISLITLLVGINYISAIFPVISYLTPKNYDGELRIMSYNVMLFGLYDWHNNVEIKNNIIDIIIEEDADILCLQEVYWHDDGGSFNPLKQIADNYEKMYIHKEAMTKSYEVNNFGLATMSKYPIINENIINFENSFNGVIVSDIVIDNDTVRVFNCHMQSIQLDQMDYTVIGTLSDTVDNYKMKLILKRIMGASRQRALQSDLVASEIKKSPYPVFVCGDLNDFPLSYTYLNLSKGLKDTYSFKGRFPGYTWNNFRIKQRIDVIFYNSKYRCTKHKVIEKSLSDHFPIIADFDKK